MRSRHLLACALLVSPVLAGCGNDQLPAGMIGGYARDVTYPDGNHRLRLDITPTGMSVTGGPGTQTVPLPGSATAGQSVKVGASGSALFKTIKCFNDFSCRFSTENGCDGTFTRDSSGSVVLVATGDCETWSGKWLSEKDAPPPTTAAPSASASDSASATAAPGLPAGVPAATASGTASASATASPSGTATASGSASGTASPGIPTTIPTAFPTNVPTSLPTAANVSCLAKCNDTNVACVKECKVTDLDCMKKCSNTLVSCAQKCQ